MLTTPSRHRRTKHRTRRACVLAAALAGLAAAPAQADFFAAVNVPAPAPRTDFDVAVVNASTGARVTLPTTINTRADERHPGITPDGRRLTFERADAAAGTVRIIAVDLTTAQSADLFSGFETLRRAPHDPAIAPDGATVFTGGAFAELRPGTFTDIVASTSLAPFPTPPFPHRELDPGYDFIAPGAASDLSAGGPGLLVQQEQRAGFRGELILTQLGVRSTFPLAAANGSATYANPALAANSTQNVLFDMRTFNADGVAGRGDIVFLPANLNGFRGTPTRLPAIVNSPLDESQPAQSADGRYVAFVRHGVDGHDRLFLWDSQTQTLLNTAGVDLGLGTTREAGAVTLYSRLVFSTSQLSLSGSVSFQLAQSTGVGLLVQRIRGEHRVLGRRVHLLGPARRVPLGRFTAGRRHARWDFKVGGRRLAPGRYLVTIRAVTPTRIVRDLGRSRVVRIPPPA